MGSRSSSEKGRNEGKKRGRGHCMRLLRKRERERENGEKKRGDWPWVYQYMQVSTSMNTTQRIRKMYLFLVFPDFRRSTRERERNPLCPFGQHQQQRGTIRERLRDLHNIHARLMIAPSPHIYIPSHFLCMRVRVLATFFSPYSSSTRIRE